MLASDNAELLSMRSLPSPACSGLSFSCAVWEGDTCVKACRYIYMCKQHQAVLFAMDDKAYEYWSAQLFLIASVGCILNLVQNLPDVSGLQTLLRTHSELNNQQPLKSL